MRGLKDRSSKLHTVLSRLLLIAAVWFLLLWQSGGLDAFALTPLDPSRGTDLTVKLSYEGAPIPGASFSLYRVGSIGENGELTLEGRYADAFNVSDPRSREDWDQLAKKMAAYCEENKIAALKTGQTNANGVVQFGSSGSLSGGLYLVVGKEVTYQGYTYTTLPFLVILPSWNTETNAWDYSVTASPKLNRTAAAPPTPTPTPTSTPGPTPTPTPKPIIIPQTGMLWWPIPPLLFLGIALIVAGSLQRKKG